MLKTDYMDDVFTGLRKYTVTENSDGTKSFTDVTEYAQQGDSFGSEDINAITKEVNNCFKKNTSVTKIITLLASGWNTTDKTYVINDPLITTTSVEEADFDPNSTIENDDIVASAKLVEIEQGQGYAKLKAKGDVPTVDVTIRVTFLGEI